MPEPTSTDAQRMAGELVDTFEATGHWLTPLMRRITDGLAAGKVKPHVKFRLHQERRDGHWSERNYMLTATLYADGVNSSPLLIGHTYVTIPAEQVMRVHTTNEANALVRDYARDLLIQLGITGECSATLGPAMADLARYTGGTGANQ